MSSSFVKVADFTADHARLVYRRMGPDLRLLVPKPLRHTPVGWAFMPRFSADLLAAVKHFLLANDITVVKIFNNDFDFVNPETGLSIKEDSRESSFYNCIVPSSSDASLDHQTEV